MRTGAPVLALLALVAIVIAAGIAVLGAKPVPDGLAQREWHWTGTGPADAPPSTVPDAAVYTIEFRADRTFLATADCAVVPGTYRLVPPGRMGPLTVLQLTPEASTSADCGAGSPAGAYVADLLQAESIAIVDETLTISLPGGRAMTFGLPAAGRSRGLQPTT